jgi:biopolymer transport protein ExbD
MTDDSQIIAAAAPDDLVEDDGEVLARRPMKDMADIDFTSMLDCVFLLLIFFLVSSTPDQDTAIELPPAQYGSGVSTQSCVIITIADREGNLPAAVYLGDGTGGTALPDDPQKQEAAVVEAVQTGFLSGEKSAVLIKAARRVREKYVRQVGLAVSKADIEDVKLHIAVFEKD